MGLRGTDSMSVQETAMPDDVSKLNRRIDELAERVQRLLSDPTTDPSVAGGLIDALERAEADRRLLWRESIDRGAPVRNGAGSPADRVPNRARVMPVRERALAGLELLGTPARASLLSIAAAARTGLPVETRQLAGLRRSELASWRSAPNRRPAYVVPALHDRRFETLRGIVASSAWDPWRRIVGPLSPRADHLRSAIRIAEHLTSARQHSEEVGQRSSGSSGDLLARSPGRSTVPSSTSNA
jgi:hypothetical protein